MTTDGFYGAEHPKQPKLSPLPLTDGKGRRPRLSPRSPRAARVSGSTPMAHALCWVTSWARALLCLLRGDSEHG